MRFFKEIPNSRPSTPLLDEINSPKDLKPLTLEQLKNLADELRAFLLYQVGQTGGHLGGGLGVVELTIVLHYLFNTPDDNLIWDVGHQSVLSPFSLSKSIFFNKCDAMKGPLRKERLIFYPI